MEHIWRIKRIMELAGWITDIKDATNENFPLKQIEKLIFRKTYDYIGRWEES